jgi:hypothetical protein
VGYCTVDELRDEGVSDPATDPMLLRRIALATAMIDRWTGRWFEPRALTVRADGAGDGALLVGPPIIALTGVRLVFANLDPEAEQLDLDELRIYNRHLTGYLDEDDRENPRVEWHGWEIRQVNGETLDRQRAGVWPRGTQNVELTGLFGYTDPDVGGEDELTGVTPPLIKHACMLIVIRNLARLGDTEAREESLRSNRLTSLRTRDQSVSYAAPSAGGSTRMLGAFSGDPEIDSILASYCRPPRLGAV